MNEVTEEFVSYFKTLLGGTRTRRDFNLDFLSSELKHCLTEDEADLLRAPITATEIKDAIFDIAEDSTPGPDGYTSAFFKAAWSVVGQEVSAAIGEFFISGKASQTNQCHTFGLNSKSSNAIPVSDYRPISCCNVIYKAITKIMVKRMQKVLDLLIDYSQNAFIPGRSISDNILLAQELLAGYNQTRLPPRADISSIQVIKHTLSEFAELSGLKVNPNKSQIILSRAVQQEKQQMIDILGFQEGSLPVKYLGVPLISSRLTIADCKPLINKLDTQIAGWSHLNLTFAGRAQLIKSVLSTLHSYWASVFILPKGIINVIEAKLRKFLWQGSTRRGYAKVAWDQLCRPKEGGLGFHNILVINKALMLKHLWKIVQNDRHSIWVDWILLHRLRNNSLWTFNGSTGSWGWKKMIKLRPVLQRGLIYQVLAGTTFKLWQDLWHQQGPLSISFPRGPEVTELIQPPNDRVVWHGLLQGRSVSTGLSGWQQCIKWASKRWRSEHLINAASRALLAALVYYIWIKRNNRKFTATGSAAESVAQRVVEEVRLRILSDDLFLLYKLEHCIGFGKLLGL
ncbi:UNVERIFIED_CONTAM: putative ribonuclease H protein [Sesamum angustifolium]|uniref:Ribonuclease H protein n=1 Tax=Sesamum angustifolium TaxID=2727405 RepID=A0AAW2ITQ8_9LAMI